MIFYDIEFLSIPKIKYDCAIEVPKYHALLSENRRLFELCLIERGECVCQGSAHTLVCEPSHLYPLVFDRDFEIYTEGADPMRMISLGIESDFSVNLVDSENITEEETRSLMTNLLSPNRFLLPRDGISLIGAEWLSQYMKKIIACHSGEKIGEETRAVSLLIELLSRVTRMSMDSVAFDAKAFPTSAVAYSEMVVSYIIKNYRKKISVIDIADEFGLTPNYLHAIFKQVKGKTIIDYLTDYRMDLAKTYIERFGLHAYEAARMVGIDDPAYFSRIFKKRYGKSISQFKRDKE